jgi:predicted TIM-barrel fold metal-dependent hydrolase
VPERNGREPGIPASSERGPSGPARRAVSGEAERLMIVSSDGHAGAEMEDYRDYLDPEYREAFDDFVVAYRDIAGGRSTDLKMIRMNFGDAVAEVWKRDYLDTGRLDGYSDPARRQRELDRDGVSGEVLFPDFAIPFAPFPASLSALAHLTIAPDQLAAGFRAYNRWLVDFCAAAPDRFAGQAAITFREPGKAIADITWAREHGIAGVVFVETPDDRDLYDPAYDAVWSAAEDLEMPFNFHIAISSPVIHYSAATSATVARALVGHDVHEAAHQVLALLIWGGVMERHPRLQFVFTEQQSDWVVGRLARMDHSYDTPLLQNSGIRDALSLKPSEYFERQCHLGSSTFSRGELRDREKIGLRKIMLGMDYPHYEGTWRHETCEYLRATLGAEKVPEAEARMMLAENAVRVFGFDDAKLAPIAARVGPRYPEILEPATAVSLAARGDVVRPLLTTG